MVTNLLGGNFTVKARFEPQLTAVYPLNFYVTTASDGESMLCQCQSASYVPRSFPPLRVPYLALVGPRNRYCSRDQ